MSLDQTNAFYVSDTKKHMQEESLKWTQPKKKKKKQTFTIPVCGKHQSLYGVTVKHPGRLKPVKSAWQCDFLFYS